jgi:hypothetical protein
MLPLPILTGLRQLPPKQLRAALADFLPQNATADERTRAIEDLLRSPAGRSLRDAMARWIVEGIVPVERLVPEAYEKWRQPVRDAMTFVVARLSAERLAPKLLEQLELPENTSAEERLLRLIAKVPGLQKLGQVIARNRHLRPALRNALARLENGIRDVKPEDIRTIIQRDLGPRLNAYAVEIAPVILSEASVSAVVRFTWRNPESGRRERGVFKVLKPHIPATLPRTWTICRDWPSTLESGITTTDFHPTLSPIRSGRSGGCCSTRSTLSASRRRWWRLGIFIGLCLECACRS